MTAILTTLLYYELSVAKWTRPTLPKFDPNYWPWGPIRPYLTQFGLWGPNLTWNRVGFRLGLLSSCYVWTPIWTRFEANLTCWTRISVQIWVPHEKNGSGLTKIIVIGWKICKGQLISKGNFSVFNSLKKRTWNCLLFSFEPKNERNYFFDFCLRI